MTRHVRRLALVLLIVVAAIGCSEDEEDGSGPPATGPAVFCQTADQAIGELQTAFAKFSGAASDPAQLQEAQQGLVAAMTTMVQALSSAPPQIAADAATVAEGLRQQLGAARPGDPAPALPPGNEEAGARVERYLRESCGISETILPR